MFCVYYFKNSNELFRNASDLIIPIAIVYVVVVVYYRNAFSQNRGRHMNTKDIGVESFAYIECYSDCSRRGALWLFCVCSSVIVKKWFPTFSSPYNICNILWCPPPFILFYQIKQNKNIHPYYSCALYIVIIILILYVYSFVLSFSFRPYNCPQFLRFYLLVMSSLAVPRLGNTVVECCVLYPSCVSVLGIFAVM